MNKVDIFSNEYTFASSFQRVGKQAYLYLEWVDYFPKGRNYITYEITYLWVIWTRIDRELQITKM